MIGAVLSHYRVIDRLGAGGMGVVYRAEDLRLGRHVAIKLLPESALADPLAVERFQREARTASALNHPNICTLHDVGEHEGRRFIVMELIDGATLDKVLAAGPLPLDRVVDVAAQVADALDAAHTEGILHRDIKPGNIFITKRGQVKVVDFGLAKMMPQRVGAFAPVAVTTVEPHYSTSTGTAVGTVAYMSPEHARGEALDQRSDLFSLGVVIYEMATGVQTFKGQTTAVVFDQILNRIPLPPSQLNPDVVPALEVVIGRLIEKDRAVRYQSARDLHADLLRLRRDLDARRVLTSASALSAPPSVSSAWAAHAGAQSAETQAVAVPTYGVAAEPIPIPAAWATGWSTSPTPAPPPPPPVSTGGSPQALVTAAGAPHAPPEARATHSRPLLPAPSSAHDGSGTAPSPGAGATAPRPAAQPESPARDSGRTRLIAGAGIATAAALVLLLAGWLLMRNGDTPAAAATNAEAVSTMPPGDAASVAPVAGDAAPALPPAAPAADTPPAPTRRPAASRAATPDPAAEAAALLARAREQLASGAEPAALASLGTLTVAYASTPSAAEAAVLLARTHQRAGRLTETVNAWVEVSKLGIAPDEAAEGLILAADAAARQRGEGNDRIARRALGELVTRHPSSRRALRALQMKMALEDRLKLREMDQEFKGATPASLLTLRQAAREGGATPMAEFALWRLAEEYKDRRLHDRAASTYSELATRFPSTRYDAWFEAGEVYEKQLRDAARARSAYANVPPSSSKYEQAQRKLRND